MGELRRVGDDAIHPDGYPALINIEAIPPENKRIYHTESRGVHKSHSLVRTLVLKSRYGTGRYGS